MRSYPEVIHPVIVTIFGLVSMNATWSSPLGNNSASVVCAVNITGAQNNFRIGLIYGSYDALARTGYRGAKPPTNLRIGLALDSHRRRWVYYIP